MSDQELAILNKIRNSESPIEELERAIAIAREIISHRQSGEEISRALPLS